MGAAMTSERSRVALYARVSTSDGSQNPEVQLDRLRAWALEHGHDDAEEYVDEASGASDQRPAWKRLEADWRRRRVRMVVVVDLDRAFRSMRHMHNTLAEWKQRSVRFVNLNYPIDTETPEGEFLVSIMGAFAQFERRIISRRVRAGMESAARRGAAIGRPRRRFTKIQAEAAVREHGGVRAAARALGIPLSTFTRRLAEGVPKG